MYAQQQNNFSVFALSNLGLSDTNSMRDLSGNFHLMKVVLVHEVHKKILFLEPTQQSDAQLVGPVLKDFSKNRFQSEMLDFERVGNGLFIRYASLVKLKLLPCKIALF